MTKPLRERDQNLHPTPDRLSILAKIRQTVGDNSEQGRVKDTLIFCITDGELMRDVPFWQRHYTHQDHTNDRAFIFFPTTKWAFNDQGELRHFSGGTVVYRQDTEERQYCLFRRRTHPIGYYTIPAGHFEMGEEPQEAALREAYEGTRSGCENSSLAITSLHGVRYRHGNTGCLTL